MSDPLSITSSVLAVATVSFTVAQGLYNLADAIGSAGKEVRIAAQQATSFSGLLTSIKTEMSRPNEVSFVEQSLAMDIVHCCEAVLRPLQRIHDTLKPLLRRYQTSSTKLRHFGLSVQYVFKYKTKLSYYLELLRHQTVTLNAVLGIMNLHANRERNPADDPLTIRSRTSLRESTDAVSRELDASRGINPHTPPLATIASTSRVIEYGGFGNLESDGETLEQVTASGEHVDGGLSEQEVENMERQIDRDLDPDNGVSALEVHEDVRFVARKVVRLAEEVLHSGEKGPFRQKQAPSFPSTASNYGMRRKPVGAETLPSGPQRRHEIITFQNSEGNRHEFPYHFACKWQNMLIMMRDVEPQRLADMAIFFSGNTKKIRLGEAYTYVLTTEDGIFLVPALWSDVIKPDDVVILKFNDTRKNKQKLERDNQKRSLKWARLFK